MTENANATLVRRGFAAFSEGDMATLTEIIARDAVQHTPGNSVVSGDHKGRDAILAFYGQLVELTDGTIKVELEQVFAKGDQVVTVFRQTAQRMGRTMDTRHSLVFQVLDGKAVDLDDFPEDEEADDAFWA